MPDLALAFRNLARARGFSALAILTLALGIGASTALFSVIYGVLLKPLPYPAPEQLVRLTEFPGDQPMRSIDGPVSLPAFVDWREHLRSFSALAAQRNASFTLTGAGDPERVTGAEVTPEFWRVFGRQPQLGRSFNGDDESGVAVLSDRLWRSIYGSRADLVGSTVRINGRPVTVLGIMPPDFDRGGAALWMPLPIDPKRLDAPSRGARGLTVLGRLRGGVPIEQAREELAALQDELRQRFPAELGDTRATALPLLDSIVVSQRPVLFSLLAPVGGLLVIGLVNVANLLLVRASLRAREIAVRAVLGASPWRVMRQLLAESFVLAALGGIGGVLLGWLGLKVILALAPDGVPRLGEVTLNLPALLVSLGLILVCAVACGLVPAWQATRVNFSAALKAGPASGHDRRASRVRHGLAVLEIGLGFALLIGAGLLMHHFVQLTRVSPGFEPENTVAAVLLLPGSRYSQVEARHHFRTTLAERFRSIPGVTDVGVTNMMPFSGSSMINVATLEGRDAARPDGRSPVAHFIATPEYFGAMRIPLLRGRNFNEQDHAAAPRVAIVSEAFALRHFPGQEALGQRVNISAQEGVVWREIIGIVGDVRNRTLTGDMPAQIYEPYTQVPSPGLGFVVRTARPLPDLGARLKQEVRALDAELPFFRLEPLSQLIAATYARQRFAAWLLGIFSVTAVLLAAVGLYGVIAFNVASRTREFGVRAAVGATPRDLLAHVLGGAARLTAVGLLMGGGVALLAEPVIESQLNGSTALPPVVLGTVALLFSTIALFASWLPARRASRVDPLVALRAE